MKPLQPYLNFKFAAIFVAYVALAFLSLTVAYLLRFDFQIPQNFIEGRNSAYLWSLELRSHFSLPLVNLMPFFLNFAYRTCFAYLSVYF